MKEIDNLIVSDKFVAARIRKKGWLRKEKWNLYVLSDVTKSEGIDPIWYAESRDECRLLMETLDDKAVMITQ